MARLASRSEGSCSYRRLALLVVVVAAASSWCQILFMERMDSEAEVPATYVAASSLTSLAAFRVNQSVLRVCIGPHVAIA